MPTFKSIEKYFNFMELGGVEGSGVGVNTYSRGDGSEVRKKIHKSSFRLWDKACILNFIMIRQYLKRKKIMGEGGCSPPSRG